MKQTRKLFILKGAYNEVEAVLEQIQFKGVTTLYNEDICLQKILQTFKNNKSVVCPEHIVTDIIFKDAIPIVVYSKNKRNYNMNKNKIDIDQDIAEQFSKIAESMNCDIGDHIQNTSGSQVPGEMQDCVFCKKAIHKQKLIYASENFYVFPTVGQFIKGYLLIVPKDHIMSYAQLNPENQQEFLTVLEDVLYILKLTYNANDYLVWENGTSQSGKGKAKDSIVHAHTHIAPSKLTIDEIERKSKFDFEEISYTELPLYSEHSYLLLRKSNKTWKINNNPNLYIPRQYIRQILAEENGIDGEQWNWRKYPFNDLVDETNMDIKRAITENWNDIPDRIRRSIVL